MTIDNLNLNNPQGRVIDLLKFNASNYPDSESLIVPTSNNENFISLTFQHIYNIVCNVTQKLDKLLDRELVQESPIVAFLSYSDTDYLWNALGLMYSNLIPLFLSPRNSNEATIDLVRNSGSKVLIYQREMEPMALECRHHIPDLILVEKLSIPDLASISPVDPIFFRPVQSKEIEYRQRAYCVHSSGSTNFPKLIYITNKNSFGQGFRRISTDGHLQPERHVNLVFFPLFHSVGINNLIAFPMVWRKPAALPPNLPPGSQYSSQCIAKTIEATRAKTVKILPIMLVHLMEYYMSQSAEMVRDSLGNVKVIEYAGAPLPSHLIKQIVDWGILPQTNFGSTETGCSLQGTLYEEDGNYRLLYTPLDPSKHLFEDTDEPNLVQLVVSGDEHGLVEGQKYDQNGNFHTGDLFEMVTKEPLRLNYLMRLNDVLVHITGEKTNPLPIEETVNKCHYVKTSAVLGRHHVMNSLLIELKPDTINDIDPKVIESTVWKYIDEANQASPSHSKIYPEMVCYLPIESSKHLPITVKGNLIRSKCYQLFAKELEQLKENSNLQSIQLGQEKKIPLDVVEMREIILQCLKLTLPLQDIDSDVSFFKVGLDSLSSVKLKNLIVNSVEGSKFTVNDIYEYDTLVKLSNFIFQQSKGIQVESYNKLDKIQMEVEECIRKFTQELKNLDKDVYCQPHEDSRTVVITGANGALGSFLLNSLVQDPKVIKIYAFVRTDNHQVAQSKVLQSLNDRKINLPDGDFSKVVCYGVNLEQQLLGLSSEEYLEIKKNCTNICQVGWRMDFLRGLSMFEDCILSTVNLMKLAMDCHFQPVFNFVSSIGATFPTKSVDQTNITEQMLSLKLTQLDACNGYNLSKLVTEHICQRWANHFKFNLRIHRIGQISGDSSNGVWNTREHVPLFLKSVQVMKMFPDIVNQSFNWVPIDVVAKTLSQLGQNSGAEVGECCHIYSPHMTSWKVVVGTMKQSGYEFEIVSVEEYLKVLKTDPKYQDAKVNPIASLSEFFDEFFEGDVVDLDIEQTCKNSQALFECNPIDNSLLTKYIQHWQSLKFI